MGGARRLCSPVRRAGRRRRTELVEDTRLAVSAAIAVASVLLPTAALPSASMACARVKLGVSSERQLVVKDPTGEGEGWSDLLPCLALPGPASAKRYDSARGGSVAAAAGTVSTPMSKRERLLARIWRSHSSRQSTVPLQTPTPRREQAPDPAAAAASGKG
jgi:hypothetical protein